MWRILICISPYIQKNLIPSHANCMQHVLRCWERQSDGTEYKKTLWTPLGELTALPQTHYQVGGWLPSPQESHPPLSALRASPLLPHSKISSDAVAWLIPRKRLSPIMLAPLNLWLLVKLLDSNGQPRTERGGDTEK